MYLCAHNITLYAYTTHYFSSTPLLDIQVLRFFTVMSSAVMNTCPFNFFEYPCYFLRLIPQIGTPESIDVYVCERLV